MIVLTKKNQTNKTDNENNKHMHINKQVKVGWVEFYDPPICGISQYVLVEQDISGQNIRTDHKSSKSIFRFRIPVTNPEISFSWNH